MRLFHLFLDTTPSLGLVVHNGLNGRVLHAMPTKEKVVGYIANLKYDFVHVRFAINANHQNSPCQLVD